MYTEVVANKAGPSLAGDGPFRAVGRTVLFNACVKQRGGTGPAE
jgi:hypothetical protein